MPGWQSTAETTSLLAGHHTGELAALVRALFCVYMPANVNASHSLSECVLLQEHLLGTECPGRTL